MASSWALSRMPTNCLIIPCSIGKHVWPGRHSRSFCNDDVLVHVHVSFHVKDSIP